MKVVSEIVENKVTEQKRQFLSMLVSTWGASLLPNILTGEGVIRDSAGTIEEVRICKIVRPLTNFEIQKYYLNESKLSLFKT